MRSGPLKQLRDALRTGAKNLFNEIREKNPKVHFVIRKEEKDEDDFVVDRVNLSGFNLAGITFEHIDFSKVVFGLASLANATFDECTFNDCYFETKVTTNLAFKNGYVVDCSFNEMAFGGIKAEGTWFQGGTQFFNCDFTGFQANTAHFVDVNVVPEKSRAKLVERYTDGIHGAKRPRKQAVQV